LTPFALLSLLAACDGPTPEVSLTTSGGHIVDSRAWAVGSRIGLSASWGTPDVAAVRLESENRESVLGNTEFNWREDRSYGPAAGAGYATMSGTIGRAAEFDAVVVDGLGREYERFPLTSEEIADVRLGVALDDCPEFADVVLPEENVFIEGSELMVYPAPVDADGNHLLGGIDFSLEGDGITVGYGWGEGVQSYPVSVQIGSGGALSMDIGGEPHRFEVRTVAREDIVGVGIAAQAEKHGYEGESLLTVFGLTEDGDEVHGVLADWSLGGQGAWVHAPDGAVVDACVGDICATWGE
jgi:hypothetical protein